jgi:hypothetical protein
MMQIDDEILMAFADGELDAARATMVRETLAKDAVLRERLERLQETDGLLRAALPPSADIPERFENLLRPATNIVQMPVQRRSARAWAVPAGTAIAAGFATLMFANMLTSGATSWLRQTGDGVAIAGSVEAAAIMTPSGELAKAGELNIRPIMSFVADDGRACRELHVRDKDMAARIVACRNADEWRIEALASMPANEFADKYHPAGVKKDPVIDAAYARLGIKTMLDTTAESQAIARKWR